MTGTKVDKNKRECVQNCNEASSVVQTIDRYSDNDGDTGTKLEVG